MSNSMGLIITLKFPSLLIVQQMPGDEAHFGNNKCELFEEMFQKVKISQISLIFSTCTIHQFHQLHLENCTKLQIWAMVL